MTKQVKSNSEKTGGSGKSNAKTPSRMRSPKDTIKKSSDADLKLAETGTSKKQPGSAALAQRAMRKTGTKTHIFIGVIIVLICGSGYLTSSLWRPYLAASPSDWFNIFDENSQFSGLTSRVDQLEKSLQYQIQRDKMLLDLEDDRQKLSQSLASLLKRIEILEHSITDVKEMAKTAANAEEVAQARRSLKALNERLAKVEPGPSFNKFTEPELKSRLEKLEKQQSFAQYFSKRITDLEEFESKSKSTLIDTLKTLSESETTIASIESRLTEIEQQPGISGSKAPLAIILVVSELRNAVQTGHAFAKELNAVKAIAGSDPAVRATLMALEKHASNGIQTLSDLRNTFQKLASSIVAANEPAPNSGWIDLTLQQISTLIRFRRIDGGSDSGSTESIVAQTEKYLAIGDLEAAVISVERLTGSAKSAAASWLMSAKARQGAEQVLGSLHTHALSLLSMAKG